MAAKPVKRHRSARAEAEKCAYVFLRGRGNPRSQERDDDDDDELYRTEPEIIEDVQDTAQADQANAKHEADDRRTSSDDREGRDEQFAEGSAEDQTVLDSSGVPDSDQARSLSGSEGGPSAGTESARSGSTPAGEVSSEDARVPSAASDPVGDGGSQTSGVSVGQPEVPQRTGQLGATAVGMMDPDEANRPIIVPRIQDVANDARSSWYGQGWFRADRILDNRRSIGLFDHYDFNLLQWLEEFKNFDQAMQANALTALMASCSLAQLRYLLITLRKCRPAFVCYLPVEVASLVINYFDPGDRDVQYLLTDDNDRYWKTRCRELKIKVPRERRADGVPDMWRRAFIRTRYAVNWNWRLLAEPSHRIIDCHGSEDINCLSFVNNRVLTGSSDHTLRLYNATTGELLHTLEGHTDQVWCAQLKKTIAISGSLDATLKVWMLETGQCVRTLVGHEQTVKCLDVHKDWVASGSRDNSVRLWNHATGECLRVFAGETGHTGEINCVRLSKNGGMIVSGSHDRLIKVWRKDQDGCVTTLQGHEDIVYSLEFDDRRIVSGSLDKSIRVWDLNGQCIHILEGHSGLTRALVLSGNMLVSANADCTLIVWDIEYGLLMHRLSGHTAPVSSVQMNANFIISASYDGTVKLWRRQNGEYLRDLFKMKYSDEAQARAASEAGSRRGIYHISADNTTLVAAFTTSIGTNRDTRLGIFYYDVVDETQERALLEPPVKETQDEGSCCAVA